MKEAPTTHFNFTNIHFKYLLVALFGLFLLWDLAACLDFYRSSALMGDLAVVTLPNPWYTPVLEDPLGIHVLMTGEGHAAPNRFWAHFITHTYFNNIPFLLQDLGASPLDSIYLACAILKLLTQIGIMLLLSKWVVGKKSIISADMVLLAAFISSFFLTANTYHRAFDIKSSMTLIDGSIAYTIFYATSICILMLYLHPFLQRIWGFKKPTFSVGQHLLLVFLSFVVSFNGPTSSPIILLLCPLLLLVLWLKFFKALDASGNFFKRAISAVRKIPKGILFHFIWIILLNLYSFYLGTFNLEDSAENPLLPERYSLLWQGFYHEYIWHDFHISPIATIFILLLLNTALIMRFIEKSNRRRFSNAFVVIGVFFVAYTLLLPLGGYRHYRPLIIRYDVIIPTTIALLFLFFYSSYLLLCHLKGIKQLIYALPLLALMVLLSIIDRVPNPPSNECEYQALQDFSTSTEQIVELPPCSILSWGLAIPPSGEHSETVAKLMYRWGVIDNKDKRFYNRKH